MRLSAGLLLVMSLGAMLESTGGEGPANREGGRGKHEPERTVFASWYNVPADSLARRRAGLAELTAASDGLRLGTLVRVTRVTNGKSVVVRITDRALHSKKARLDLCKEAAEQLEMVSDGIARVRVEVLPHAPAAASPHRPND